MKIMIQFFNSQQG